MMTEDTTTITEGGGEKPARPEWAPEQFWDADAGQVRVEDLAKSYREAHSLIGRRVGDLSPEARRKLAESLPDEMRAAWRDEVRASLVEDEEFLAPLRDKWSEGLPKAPDAYDFEQIELPGGRAVDTENPLVTKAAELAKEWGLSQERFAAMLALGAELTPAPMTEEEAEADLKARMAEVGPDFAARGMAAVNKARSAAGADPQARAAVEAVISELKSPDAFRGFEILLATRGERRMPDDTGGQPAVAQTEAELNKMQADPRYWKDRDPSFIQQVQQGFARLYTKDTL